MGNRLLHETEPTESPVIERLERENATLRAELATARAETWALRRWVDRLLGQDKQGEPNGT